MADDDRPDCSRQVIIDPDEKTIDIRQSAIQDFLDCRRKFKLSYIDGLEYNYADGPRPWTTADTGTGFHEGIGAYYLDKDPDDAIESWFEEQWPTGLPQDHKVDMARIMTHGHISDLADSGDDIGEETIAVEESIVALIVIGDWRVYVHGKVDRLIETETGVKIIDDWKSVVKLDSTLNYIQQLGRYALLVRVAKGWRADRIRTTQVKRVMRTKVGDKFYSRPWLPFTEDMYAEHAGNLRGQLTDLVRCIEDEGPWYEHVTGECDWKCRVAPICQAMQQGDDPELLIQLHYREKTHQ